MTANGSGQSGDLAAGASLILAASIAVLAMAHHPTSAHAGGGIGDYVHGTMIAVLTVMFYGFAHFALRRGIRRPLVLGGLIAYAVSLVANLGAATVNGFVVPALAARGPDALSHDIFVLCWEANQALARLGVFAAGTAYLLWSIDLLLGTGIANRLIGSVGLFAAIVPAAALAGDVLSMNVGGAFVIYAAHAAWAVLVGVQLLRRAV